MMMVTRLLQLSFLLVNSFTIIGTECTRVLFKTQTQDPNLYNVTKTIVHSAVSKGAVCLDGTPPGYHFDAGFGDGVENWILQISGGAWCTTTEECVERSMGYLGSLDPRKDTNETWPFKQFFSKNKSANPDFYNWNKVLVRYCDGGSFTGDIEYVDPKTNLHFRGARILPAILEDLLAKGLKDAKNAILAGSSAGAYPAMLYCDYFHSQLPNCGRVKCLVDAGYFSRYKKPELARPFESIFEKVVRLHGSAKTLPKSCTSRMKPELCLFPENIQQDIKTPLYISMSAFDNVMTQTTLGGAIYGAIDEHNWNASMEVALKEMRLDFLSNLPKGDNPKLRGVFVDSVHHHTSLQARWTPGNEIMIQNLSAPKAFADWYFDRNHSYVIDHQHVFPLPNVIPT